ncbi:RNA methyltransferase [Taylorella equigenitalis]|uniref:TrmH family RNA methyltransferase n=1 Tax=Taylorella equigenitalis TaxID=29575 RepID=UPI0004083FB5|nr:RNA methyltransferase [Taylorella equigenitalis]WDU47202.1 RNA methyltransferase [Taylorella equigenitalis]
MEIITSKENLNYKNLKKALSNNKCTQTVLEGPHLVKQWLDSGRAFNKFVMSETLYNKGGNDFEGYTISNPIVLSDNLFKSLSEVVTNQGILLLIDIPTYNINNLSMQNTIVLLDSIQDPGNLGTLLRTCVAVGISDVALNKGCSSAWSSKVLRSAQGSHAFLKIYHHVDLIGLIEILQAGGYEIIATALDLSSKNLFELNLNKKIAWIFGNEGNGVSSEILSLGIEKCIIPINQNIESLNVGVAASICLYEQYRQKTSR